MATGDIVVFEEAKKTLLMGGWEPADEIWLGIVTNSPAVTAADAAPAYGSGGTTNYTAISTAGNYAAGGVLLNTLTAMLIEAAGTVTFNDTDATVVWSQDASNPATGYWGIIYHKTSGLAIAFIDLGGPVDMSAGDLTVTWNASGIFTLA